MNSDEMITSLQIWISLNRNLELGKIEEKTERTSPVEISPGFLSA